MLFDQAAKDALAAPLDMNNVKKREGKRNKQTGKKLYFDYISGEHAISEANRIFGFDGWSCETVHMECVKEQPITYIARVRIRAGGVTREGWGGGDSFDHEMAVKGAETDAIKRALRTFGNQFGLPLYDKEENAENLTRGSEPAPTSRPTPSAEYKRTEKLLTEEVQSGDFWKTRTGLMNAGPETNWAAAELGIRQGINSKGQKMKLNDVQKADLIKLLNERKKHFENAATS